MPVDFKLSAEDAKEVQQKVRTGGTGGGAPEVKPKVPGSPEIPKKGEEKKEPAKLSEWDKNILPILEEYPDLQDVLNYKNSKHIMRAINGRYTNVMEKTKLSDPIAYQRFKAFTDNATAIADQLKKISTGEFDVKAFNKHLKTATTYYNDIADSYSYDRGKSMAMNPDGVLMSREQYEKWDQEPKVSKKASNSARVVYDEKAADELVADYETGNISSGYQKLKNIDNHYRSSGVNLIQPITKSWVSTSLQRIDLNKPLAERDTCALNMNSDILSHIGKYRTTLDPELSAKDQQNANNILKQLKGKNRNEQLKILKDNSEDINGMASRMGYYGNATIYNKYKKQYVGKTLDYYPNSNAPGKARVDYYNMTQENGAIDTVINNYRAFRNVDKDVRLKTLDIVTEQKWEAIRDGADLGEDLTKKDMETAFKSLIDANGNIRSLEAWKKELGKAFTTTMTVEGEAWRDASGKEVAPGEKRVFKENQEGFRKFYNKIAGMTGADWFVTPYNQKHNYLYNSESEYDVRKRNENISADKERQFRANKEQEQAFIETYTKLKRAYKKTFDDVKVKQVYPTTLVEHGFGKDWNQALEYHGVNLKTDKSMRLLSTEGPKQENVNKIFGMLLDSDGNVDTEEITLFGDKDIKEGLNALQKDDLKDQRKNNEQVLKNFLKNDNTHVTMRMFRNTNVPGQAAYEFYDTKSKKSMMVYVPKNKIGANGVKEDLYTKTGRNPLDFTFRMAGKLEMPIINNDKNKPAYQSAVLTLNRETDEYVGEINYWKNGELATQKYTVPYASAISINEAQRNFLNYITTVKNDL